MRRVSVLNVGVGVKYILVVVCVVSVIKCDSAWCSFMCVVC